MNRDVRFKFEWMPHQEVELEQKITPCLDWPLLESLDSNEEMEIMFLFYFSNDFVKHRGFENLLQVKDGCIYFTIGNKLGTEKIFKERNVCSDCNFITCRSTNLFRIS